MRFECTPRNFGLVSQEWEGHEAVFSRHELPE